MDGSGCSPVSVRLQLKAADQIAKTRRHIRQAGDIGIDTAGALRGVFRGSRDTANVVLNLRRGGTLLFGGGRNLVGPVTNNADDLGYTRSEERRAGKARR